MTTSRLLVPHDQAPRVVLSRILKIHTYEVMEADLEALNRATDREQQSHSFMLALLGIAISTGVSWQTQTSTLTPTAYAVYVAVTLVFLILGLAAAGVWIGARKERPQIIARIRSSATHVVEEAEFSGGLGN